MSIAFKPRRMILHIHNVACTHFFFHCSYSLYEPKDIVLSEYKGGFEKAILKNSTLLVELNDAFCQTHPWLAQKVCTKSAHAAVSKVSADAVLKMALNVCRKKAGEFLKDVRAINAIKLEEPSRRGKVPYCWFRAFILLLTTTQGSMVPYQ